VENFAGQGLILAAATAEEDVVAFGLLTALAYLDA
jgi:predicted outer membrane lipoprotein